MTGNLWHKRNFQIYIAPTCATFLAVWYKWKTLTCSQMYTITHAYFCSLFLLLFLPKHADYDWLLGNSGNVAAQECPLQESHTPMKFQHTGESRRHRQTWKTSGIYINSCLKALGGLVVYCLERDLSQSAASVFHHCTSVNSSALYCSLPSPFTGSKANIVSFMNKLLSLRCGPVRLIKVDGPSRTAWSHEKNLDCCAAV